MFFILPRPSTITFFSRFDRRFRRRATVTAVIRTVNRYNCCLEETRVQQKQTREYSTFPTARLRAYVCPLPTSRSTHGAVSRYIILFQTQFAAYTSFYRTRAVGRAHSKGKKNPARSDILCYVKIKFRNT